MGVEGVSVQEAGERLRAVAALLRDPPEPECDHIATVTTSIYFVYGPYVGTTDPVTICVTCHACVHDPPDWAIDDTRFTVDLEEQP